MQEGKKECVCVKEGNKGGWGDLGALQSMILKNDCKGLQ